MHGQSGAAHEVRRPAGGLHRRLPAAFVAGGRAGEALQQVYVLLCYRCRPPSAAHRLAPSCHPCHHRRAMCPMRPPLSARLARRWSSSVSTMPTQASPSRRCRRAGMWWLGRVYLWAQGGVAACCGCTHGASPRGSHLPLHTAWLTAGTRGAAAGRGGGGGPCGAAPRGARASARGGGPPGAPL